MSGVAVYTLDCAKKQIRVRVNEKDDVVLFEDIFVGHNVRYKVAMAMYNKDTSITISVINGKSKKSKQDIKEADQVRSMSYVITFLNALFGRLSMGCSALNVWR